jgi:hypothetical protein
MKKILRLIRSLFEREPDDRRSAARVVVAAPARLLAGLSLDGQKIVAATVNLSAAGLAVVVPSPHIGTRPISKDDRLRITLDLHPLGIVEMIGLVRRVEGAEEGVRYGHVLALKIVQIGHLERALYLEYLGTRGWESVTAAGERRDGAGPGAARGPREELANE